jgi:hypothetical protein
MISRAPQLLSRFEGQAVKIGKHPVFSLHTNRETGMRTALLHNGDEWVTAVIPKSFGPEPSEWWQGHYHGESYPAAWQDFLERSGLCAVAPAVSRP